MKSSIRVTRLLIENPYQITIVISKYITCIELLIQNVMTSTVQLFRNDYNMNTETLYCILLPLSWW